jgi:pyruvate,water dikinase
MVRVGELLDSCGVPESVERQLRGSYTQLVVGDVEGTLVAVRSSVGTRDLSASSFPGQMDTYHNVPGIGFQLQGGG